MTSDDRIDQAREIARRILSHGVHRDDVEDCVQTVMLQLVPKLLDASIEKWSGLVATIALRVKSHWIRDLIRRRSHETALPADEDALPAPVRDDADPFPLDELDALVLSDRCRQMLEMLVVQGKRIEEIRAVLGLTSTQFDRSIRLIGRAMDLQRRQRGDGGS